MEKAQSQLILKLNNFSEKISHYFFAKTFPVQIGLLVTLCYIADITILALTVISLLATFVFLFYKNLAPILPLLFMVVMAFQDYSLFSEPIAYAILSPAAISIIARPFIHPVKWNIKGILVYPLILVSLSFALAGINKEDYDFMFGVAYFLSLGPVMLIIYLLFSSNLTNRKDFCIKKYLCYCLVVTGLAMTVEIIYTQYALQLGPNVELGWVNINGCAAFLLLSIPACYYLIIKSRIILPLILCLIALYVGMLLTSSDAAFGISIIYTPFLLFYTYKNLYRTKRMLFTYSTSIIIIAVASAIIILMSKYGYEGTLALLQLDTSDSGRNAIYDEAKRLFRENPLFGYGLQYNVEGRENSSIGLYNFHSTLFHVAATMGIFGLISYGLYFLIRFIILMRNYSPFTMTMLTAFIMYESYAMVDTGEFNAVPLMSAVTVIITVVEWATKKDNATTALPLTVNKRYGYYF